MWVSALDDTYHASQTLELVFLLQYKAEQNKTYAFSVYRVAQPTGKFFKVKYFWIWGKVLASVF